MRQTFSGPAVADCLPISYVLRIGSGSKSHGAVLLPLDLTNMMSQPADQRSSNESASTSYVYYLPNRNHVGRVILSLSGEKGGWAREDGEVSGDIEKAISMFITECAAIDSFSHICIRRENRIHPKIISILNIILLHVVRKFLSIGVVQKINESRGICFAKLRVSDHRERRNSNC